MNLKLYFTNEDYKNLAGPDWPDYDDLVTGNYIVNDAVKKEIDQAILNAKSMIVVDKQYQDTLVDKLSLYVTEDDYAEGLGISWPNYKDYIAGTKTTNLSVQKEIDQFTNRHLTQGIKFPIKSATACQSKWTWSTIYLNQLSTASCHRVQPIQFEFIIC
jgi:hypothetical protein